MNAIEIVLTVCMLSNPSSCEVKNLPIADVATLRQCMTWAQPQIAEWSSTHPKYKIQSWRCAYPNTMEEPT